MLEALTGSTHDFSRLAQCVCAQATSDAGVVQNLPFLGYTRRAETADL